MNNEEKLLFSSFLKINYDTNFIKPAQDFVKNLSVIAGADQKEAFQLTVLMEECLSFIINKYIDARLEAYIEINFKLFQDGSIHIELTDIGPPIYENKIPVFNFKDESSEEGLWFNLVKKLSDEFEFVNRLNKGWLIWIIKKIKNVTFQQYKEIDKVSEYMDTSGKKIIRQATEDDAPALVDLAFMTYRYTNSLPEFYDVETLKKHISEKLYDIFVVEHKDKIIGAFSIKYTDLNAKSAEASRGMVAPEYRNSTAIRLIMRKLKEYHIENPRNCDFFVSYAVTTHVRSQKLLSKIHKGYKPLSISLNIMPRPEYVGIKGKSYSRESLINYYHFYDKFKMDTMYIPFENFEIIRELISNTGNEITLLTDMEEPSRKSTELSHFTIEPVKSTIVFLKSFGKDWSVVLLKKIVSLVSSGIEAIILNIPTSNPLPRDMNKTLLNMNFIFSGLSVVAIDNLNLSYCFSTKEVDFGKIQLESEVAKKLLKQVERQCDVRRQEYGGLRF